MTCGRSVQNAASSYREFLLDPGTLITGLAALLLLAAMIVQPSGVVSSNDSSDQSLFYVASALVGSIFIWWSAFQGIRERDFTADIPVSIATIAAIAIGEFSAAAVVAVLLLVGGLLEEAVAARAGRALESLESLLPTSVSVLRDGVEEQVGLSEVVVGDLVLVRPGERVAVDGEVVSGIASVDQATITGESVPVSRASGDHLFAGTLASEGALTVRADKVGEETTLGQIRRMVAEAEEQKAPVERILDRYAKLYTPVAIILALILYAISGSATSAITMLIVFCPCVMVLATPTALVASIGNAALRGSLVKQGSAVEAMSSIDAVLFDKTGTLTTGQVKLAEVTTLNGVPADEVLRLAASAERFSEHPLARAVVREAEEKRLTMSEPKDFETFTGLGVRATVDGREVSVGRREFFERSDAQLSSPIVLPDGGGIGTQVAVVLEREQVAVFTFHDQIRPEAAETVNKLKELGIRTALVTGDNEKNAKRIAESVGIDDVRANVLPAEKAQVVNQIQDQGHRVAFVGDGVNDGPALSAADAGVAMGVTGTDLALETAQVALLSDDLSKLPHLLDLSQKAMKAIRQNLAFSLGILAIAVVLTFAEILGPVSGALLHELSSIPVIANSARLIGLRPR